jgi:predicted TIM-barrel fold metal-dependent hydrolase
MSASATTAAAVASGCMTPRVVAPKMIIDTHVHFYDPFRPEGVPWPPKKNDLLYRTVVPKDYRAVPDLRLIVNHAAGAQVTGEAPDDKWLQLFDLCCFRTVNRMPEVPVLLQARPKIC